MQLNLNYRSLEKAEKEKRIFEVDFISTINPNSTNCAYKYSGPQFVLLDQKKNELHEIQEFSEHIKKFDYKKEQFYLRSENLEKTKMNSSSIYNRIQIDCDLNSRELDKEKFYRVIEIKGGYAIYCFGLKYQFNNNNLTNCSSSIFELKAGNLRIFTEDNKFFDEISLKSELLERILNLHDPSLILLKIKLIAF